MKLVSLIKEFIISLYLYAPQGERKVQSSSSQDFWSWDPCILLKLLRTQRAFTYKACIYLIRN